MARPRTTRKAILLPSTDVSQTGLENLALFHPEGTPFPSVICEITDVHLDEGTDLSSSPMLIGKPFVWPEGRSAVGIAMLIIETYLPAGDDLILEIDIDEAANQSLIPMAVMDSSDLSGIKTSIELEARPPSVGGSDSPDILWGTSNPWYVHLWTNSPLSADVHVVRARVAYFFI